MKCRAMTRIMHICVVLVVMVSVFFYVPMEVSAEEIDVTVNTQPIELSDSDLSQLGIPVVEQGKGYYYDGYVLFNSNPFDLIDRTLDLDAFYAVHITGSVDAYSDVGVYLRNSVLTYGYGVSGSKTLYFYLNPSHGHEFSSENFFSVDTVLYGYGRELVGRFFSFSSRTLNTTQNPINFTFDLNFNIDSVTPLTGEESESYQQGYDVGYSAGEEAGESNGYSSGYSDGYEAGEQSGYDSGFQAGSESVDTQSYYDAGYSAGYDAGYSTGYDTGYDEGYDAGWSAYEEQMDKWGADTSDYPLLIQQTDGTFDLQFDFIQPARVDDVISDYCDIGRYYSGIDFNPNHTYRLDFTYHDFEYDYSDSYFTAAYSFWLYWGSCSFPITVGTKDDITSSFYISGDQIGTGLKFRCDVSGLEAYSEYFGVLHYYINDCTLKLYDMGPSGDTQNHIANQTDQLTNGYDSSQGAAVNDDFKASVNDYHTAEDSLFSTATTSLENFTFLDFTSITGMVTSLSFVTSIMTSIYMAMGGDTGASGIILAVLFSVMLVSMAIGLYRYYVSNGKSDGSGKGGD